jgi:hypothetical protein
MPQENDSLAIAEPDVPDVRPQTEYHGVAARPGRSTSSSAPAQSH